jgi:L-ascorbate metabolism protein UlaG (beta-lactamase superfamily)
MLDMHPVAASDLVYLRPEAKLEPLVCRFYAWPHLIAPAQLALHIAFRFVPLLRSFIDNPGVHLAASADPNLYGGPFVDLGADDLPRVSALLADIESRCAPLLTLAHDLRALDARLQQEATGQGVGAFYAELPASLRGLVEVLYDQNHRPALRLFERLLADAYDLAETQEIMLTLADEGDRPFFMSTPRVERPGNMFFAMPFTDPRIDALAEMRSRPAAFARIAALFGIEGDMHEQFQRYFTRTAPPDRKREVPAPGRVRVRYFGHACVLVETAETSFLFDPMLALEPLGDGRLCLSDLPEQIDYVVLSHPHQDHFNPEMLLQLRSRIGQVVVPRNNGGFLADPSMKLCLERLGLRDVVMLDLFERVGVPGGELLSLPFTGEHGDLNILSKHCLALSLHGRKLLFLVDSDGRDPMLYHRVMHDVGPIDALFLGMECDGAPLNWLYEPLLTNGVGRRNNESRRLSGADCARAQAVLSAIETPRVYIYAMGQEPWLKYIMGLEYTPDAVQLRESNRFMQACADAGIEAERLYLHKELLL